MSLKFRHKLFRLLGLVFLYKLNSFPLPDVNVWWKKSENCRSSLLSPVNTVKKLTRHRLSRSTVHCGWLLVPSTLQSRRRTYGCSCPTTRDSYQSLRSWRCHCVLSTHWNTIHSTCTANFQTINKYGTLFNKEMWGCRVGNYFLSLSLFAV